MEFSKEFSELWEQDLSGVLISETEKLRKKKRRASNTTQHH